MRDVELRDHIVYLLDGGGAHLDFDSVVAGFPTELRGATIASVPYSPWQLVEHLRICQWDILEFCRNATHISPKFPEGYWPQDTAPPTDLAWDESLSKFRNDRHAIRELVLSTDTDLFATIPHGDGQTYLREALLVADHNAYHLGQLIVLRRALGAWPQGR